MTARQRGNWAGNITFAAAEFHRPASVAGLRAVVARARRVRARYERLPGFLDLAGHYDPAGKFRNAYTARCLAR